MNHWKKVLITLTALVTLSACGGNATEPSLNNTENETNVDQSEQQNNNEQNDASENDETEPSNSEENATSDQEANTDETDSNDSPNETSETVKIEYEMNGVYDIVPLTEDVNRNIVLLTFDDGPKDEKMVNDMLDILDKYEAKAIFFVNGYRVEQNPELLKLIAERGHPIGNHAWDHILLRDLSKEEIDQQVGDVQAIVEELTGERPLFFRPPHGAGSDILREKVASEGMLYMTWSNGSEDWVYEDPDTVIQRVMEQLRPGSNILMHELPWTVEALDSLLEKISEEGYEFVHPEAIRITD